MPRSTLPAKATSATSSAAGAPATPGLRKLTLEQLGQRLLRLLKPLCVQSVSLHNSEGELLWLSEGVFGPDEHGYVLDALDLFVIEAGRPYLERSLEDGRRALFLCARTPLGDRCGLALAVVETRSSQAIDSELLTPPVAKLMRQFSMLLAPPVVSAPAPPNERAAAAAPSATAGVGSIHARRYARLRAGGRTRRYEVSGVSTSTPAEDLALTVRVIDYLQRASARYKQEPASFAVPLCADSVSTANLLKQLRPALQRAQLPEGLLGFCIPATAWSERMAPTQQFISQCAALGCFVALDDFTLGKSGFDLLRSSALRCLKLDAELIASAMSDKFAQATVSAIIQAARVLGLYCVAKSVENASQAQWFATAGIEFSDALSRGGISAATTKSGELMALEAVS